jgi:hypothetical protein
VILVFKEDCPPDVDLRNIDYFKGLAMQILHTGPCKFSEKDKNEYELGRTHMFGLLVRSEFESSRKLGLSALQNNNRYFGNFPRSKGSKINDQPAFEIKRKFLTLLANYKYKATIWSMLQKVASLIKLNQLDDKQFATTIEKNIKSFDDVSDLCRRKPVRQTKRRKKNAREDVLPQKPSTSPVMLSQEMRLFASLVDPIWTSLDPYKSDWIGSVEKDGFAACSAAVRKQYARRWEILTKFSSMTTKRLQAIRSLSDLKKNTSKRDIVKDNVIALIKSRPDASTAFWNEVIEIIKTDIVLVKEGFSQDGRIRATSELKSLVLNRITDDYNSIVFSESTKTNVEIKVALDTSFRLGYIRGFQKELSKAFRQGRAIYEMTRRIRLPYYGDLLTALKRLKATYSNYVSQINRIGGHDPKIFEALTRIASGSGEKTHPQQAFKELQERVNRSIEDWNQNFNSDDIYNCDLKEKVKKLIETMI